MLIFNQTKIRGVIAILKNANILVTKDASRNPVAEVAQLILIKILQEQVQEVAAEVIKESFQNKITKPSLLDNSNKMMLLYSGDIERNISFQIVTETILSLASTVAVEVYTAACIGVGPPKPRGLAIEK
jgi:hypothetical protein